MRTIPSKTLLLLIMASLLLASCTGHKYDGDDVSTLGPITVVREKTPELYAPSLGGSLLMALGGIVTVAAGMAVNEHESEKVRNGISIPDYGKILAEEFASRAKTEVKGMPAIKVVDQPVGDDYKVDQGTLISFRVNTLKLESVTDSLIVISYVTMEDAKGKTLWKKCAFYRSYSFDREKSSEEFQANHGKLLQEEMKFAADTTVTNYLKDLKGELKDDNLGC